MSKDHILIQQLNRIVQNLPNAHLYQTHETPNELQPILPISLEKMDPICIDDDIDEISDVHYTKPNQIKKENTTQLLARSSL